LVLENQINILNQELISIDLALDLAEGVYLFRWTTDQDSGVMRLMKK
jgi:hypothetical protein